MNADRRVAESPATVLGCERFLILLHYCQKIRWYDQLCLFLPGSWRELYPPTVQVFCLFNKVHNNAIRGQVMQTGDPPQISHGRAEITSRVRLAGSQRIIALAEMSDGSYWHDVTEIVVTASACVDGSE